ncbi:hypothetical protein [Streptomyces sp. H27-S2]|uniref:hypothetical protein n=1 Tax=Streptomyces antarcticus TaxID=2996458 RepID=UPI0022709F90|nr:hypothetical protein [Streptomyces sp. H27-S2]MCY0949933.1 hypothetical protein [Streptomyces sp. H27-S2]
MGPSVTLTCSVPAAYIRIDHYGPVRVASEVTRASAQECGLTGALPHQAAVIASELARNIAKHATYGALSIHPLPLGGGLEILAADHGPGSPELERCRTDGFTTTSTLGAVSRVAATFTIETRPGTGTLVRARLALPGRRQAAHQDTGLVSLPADIGTHCADAAADANAAAVLDTGTARTADVIDGLGHGHGHEAAEAAQAAPRSFRDTAEQPLPHILTAPHRALRHTRGTAVGIARPHAERAECSGTGDVRTGTLSPHHVHRRVTGRPGIVGRRTPAPHTRHARQLLRPAGTAVVLPADGIDPQWSHTPTDFPPRPAPPLLAAAIAPTPPALRFQDDATVSTARPGQVTS